MSAMAKRRIGFPRMDNYNVALKYLVETGCGCEYVMAPPMTRKTLELGSKYSPDFVCAPFKYTLGSMLEMLQSEGNINQKYLEIWNEITASH